jgi:hypothetical protein
MLYKNKNKNKNYIKKKKFFAGRQAPKEEKINQFV